MSLEHLWAGWRSAYVTSVSAPEADSGGAIDASPEVAPDETPEPAPGREACVFCALAAAEDLPEQARQLVHRGDKVMALLNAYPYTTGHLMVMPVRHVGELEALGASELAELWHTVESAVKAVKAAYSPDGINLGANLGRAAGAGIPKHLHLHVVPRWAGDTNFMTTIASTRVLSEALPDTWSKLRAAWPH